MLDLLIAHYKEPMSFIKRLLDSIQEQYTENINVYIAVVFTLMMYYTHRSNIKRLV